MKKIVVIALAAIITGCGSMKNVPTPKNTPDAPAQADTLAIDSIKAMPESDFHDVLTVKDALLMLSGGAEQKATMKKYGYKYKGNYEVSMLDKYKNLYYKNCRLPQMIRPEVYADMPRPLKKGTSSYVAINDRIEVGVFNNKAYQQLLDQIKACGFRLDQPGNEDTWVRGDYQIYAYATGRRLRFEHVRQ